jgi:hypothetical protein
MEWEDIQQFVRKGADWAAGALVVAGGFDPSQAPTISGIIVGIASLAWWWAWNKWLKKPAKAA